MDIEQEQVLVGGGDCFLHHHTEDRAPSHAFLQGLNELAQSVNTDADLVLRGSENYVLVDTSAGNTVTISLPKAKNQLEIEVLKTFSAGTIIVAPMAPDTILGQTSSVSISTGNSALHFKAFETDWRII